MASQGQVTHSYTESQAGILLNVIQYQPTARPIEDRFSITVGPNLDRLIVGVYDGHGGIATAEHISQVLPESLLGCLPGDHVQIFQKIDATMLSNFASDHSLFRPQSKEWVQRAHIVKSGCTALILDIDVKALIASHANLGDSRAVICNAARGRLNQTLFHTTDLNAKTPSEQRRLSAEHPNEDLLIVSGRLFGKLMSTRGFGDGYYKLPRGLMGNKQHRKYINVFSSLESSDKVPMNAQYESYFYGYRTPPYLIATPDVGITRLEEGGFAIIATDGLWDCISSEDASTVVRRGIDRGEENVASDLLQTVMKRRLPGDDVTIIVLRF